MDRFRTCGSVVLLFLAAPAGAAPPAPSPSMSARRTPVVEAFERARDAVVNISATQIIERSVRFTPFDDFFDWPLPGERRRQFQTNSLGSGFIIHPDGYVVTNAHVVARAKDQKVIFADKTEYPAVRVAVDEEHDLAILKIQGDKTFPAITLGRSHDLMIGETVVAIGNPLGFQHTVTAGIISALDRTLEIDDQTVYQGLIQTDAPINPGNSGGPLLNVLGELIGIDTAIRGDAQNIGFAIPVDTLRKLVPEMLAVEKLRRLEIGIRLAWKSPTVVVESSGPAAEAGVEIGDELLRADGKPIRHDVDYYIHVLNAKEQTPVVLEVRRGDRRLTAKVTPRRIPIPDGARLMREKFGLTVVPLAARDAQALDLPGGLRITQVEPGSPADRAGLVPNLIVVQLGRHFPKDLEEVGLTLEHVRRGDKVLIRVYEVQRNFVVAHGGMLIAR